jgi:hypothetical protein
LQLWNVIPLIARISIHAGYRIQRVRMRFWATAVFFTATRFGFAFVRASTAASNARRAHGSINPGDSSASAGAA